MVDGAQEQMITIILAPDAWAEDIHRAQWRRVVEGKWLDRRHADRGHAPCPWFYVFLPPSTYVELVTLSALAGARKAAKRAVSFPRPESTLVMGAALPYNHPAICASLPAGYPALR
jgi:hypothetical protein